MIVNKDGKIEKEYRQENRDSTLDSCTLDSFEKYETKRAMTQIVFPIF